MNKIYAINICFIFLFILPIPNTSAQEILSEDNKWYVLDTYYHVSKIYRLVGDTIMQNYTYKKLFIEDEENPAILSAQNLFFRNEEDRVYVIDENLEEQLLYDFSLSIGDTLNYLDCFIEVLSVDLITLLNNAKRKRLNVQINYPDGVTKLDSWIEGIGSASGLFYPYKHCNRLYYSSLDCFFIGTEKIYKAPHIDGDGCLFVLINNTKEPLELSTLTVYPNPGMIEWHIESEGNIRNAVYMVFNSTGRVVMQGLISNNNTPYSINIEELPQGMYYLYLVAVDQIYLKRVIKI
jgi:hypothetical protein